MKRGIILLAGGVGSRFRGEKPKQFLSLMGRAVLDYSLEVLLQSCEVLCIVCHVAWKEELFSLSHWSQDILVVDGGETRQQSVYRGLWCVKDHGVDVVAVHDGARPFVSRKLLQEGWERLEESIAVIPVVPLTQTVAAVRDGVITHYLDRSSLVTIQTPQFFRLEALWQAHYEALQKGITDATDDSQLLQKSGFSVDTINGELWNIKITTPEDMILAEAYLKQGVNL